MGDVKNAKVGEIWTVTWPGRKENGQEPLKIEIRREFKVYGNIEVMMLDGPNKNKSRVFGKDTLETWTFEKVKGVNNNNNYKNGGTRRRRRTRRRYYKSA